MDNEIMNVETEFQRVFTRLINYTNFQIQNAIDTEIFIRSRNSRIRRIHEWFVYHKNVLYKRREYLLQEIQKKYKNVSTAQPAASQPAPVKPAPVKPAPVQPAPVQQVASQPAPVKPATVQQVASQPTKKACLVGINYTDGHFALSNCINDVLRLRYLLINSYGFNNENVEVITNKNATKSEILHKFTELIKNASEGDSIFFSFSANGVNVKEGNNNEVMVSADFKAIMNDEVQSILKQHMKKGVKLCIFLDNYYSELMLNLQYNYTGIRMIPFIENNGYKELEGEIVCLSGCQDTSYTYNGAMTSVFAGILSSDKNVDWNETFRNMKETLTSKRLLQKVKLSVNDLPFNVNDSVFKC